MSILNRITASFSASVDKVVSQFENHEAVIDASIADSRTLAAKARVRSAGVVKDGDAMRRKLSELQSMELTWAERARVTAAVDEQKALACLQRRNTCRQQITTLQESLLRQEEAELQLATSLEKIEKRLAEVIQQRNAMRSRHSAADAMLVLNDVDGMANNNVDDMFERWEVVLSEAEHRVGQGMPIDVLEREYCQTENDALLREELVELLGQNCTAGAEDSSSEENGPASSEGHKANMYKSLEEGSSSKGDL
ncbi:hypothetical protein A9Q90_03525 [Gammaproteobacteria bacterium 54_18_T64]|nr:hypothetical protein A9Q90_03525 [Gammaproteobacteria bacterium 54_18_T64]